MVEQSLTGRGHHTALTVEAARTSKSLILGEIVGGIVRLYEVGTSEQTTKEGRKGPQNLPNTKEPEHTAAVHTDVCGEHVRHVLRSAVRH